MVTFLSHYKKAKNMNIINSEMLYALRKKKKKNCWFVLCSLSLFLWKLAGKRGNKFSSWYCGNVQIIEFHMFSSFLFQIHQVSTCIKQKLLEGFILLQFYVPGSMKVSFNLFSVIMFYEASELFWTSLCSSFSCFQGVHELV